MRAQIAVIGAFAVVLTWTVATNLPNSWQVDAPLAREIHAEVADSGLPPSEALLDRQWSRGLCEGEPLCQAATLATYLGASEASRHRNSSAFTVETGKFALDFEVERRAETTDSSWGAYPFTAGISVKVFGDSGSAHVVDFFPFWDHSEKMELRAGASHLGGHGNRASIRDAVARAYESARERNVAERGDSDTDASAADARIADGPRQ